MLAAFTGSSGDYINEKNIQITANENDKYKNMVKEYGQIYLAAFGATS